MRERNDHGQLLLPMLAVLFLFGLFWIPYVLWCRQVYWVMRMDATADLVALSAARQQAMLLNYMATTQTLQNAYVGKVNNYGLMDVSMRSSFDALNRSLRTMKETFVGTVYAMAEAVAKANGANRPVVPLDDISSRLEPQSLRILYVADGWPVGFFKYDQAFYVRQWSPRILQAQPDHKSYWMVCREDVCSTGRARLWLDVEASSALHNGGFPTRNASLLRSVGFQCFYPQFNARLSPKP